MKLNNDKTNVRNSYHLYYSNVRNIMKTTVKDAEKIKFSTKSLRHSTAPWKVTGELFYPLDAGGKSKNILTAQILHSIKSCVCLHMYISNKCVYMRECDVSMMWLNNVVFLKKNSWRNADSVLAWCQSLINRP